MSSYVLGINKYSHSASCALLSPEGDVALALAKERITRKKYDGGDVAALLRYCLERTGLDLSDIGTVVETCHLFRIDLFEPRLPFTAPLRYYPQAYLDDHNLAKGRAGMVKYELSHHLAHAYAALHCAPFDDGLVVVMDGMGSLRSEMTAPPTSSYFGESEMPRADGFAECPGAIDETRQWREAETVYAFSGPEMQRVFKRWTPLRSPSLLYNYGFENMESLGAVYSRVASHIFGDWNACGKVMGLAGYGEPNRVERAMSGPLEDLRVNWPWLESLGHVNAWDGKSPLDAQKDLAATVQADLEGVVIDFLRRLRDRTGARNVVLSGGVALNSQLNGRVARECGFDAVYVPPAPGDDGAALGCAAFGLRQAGHTFERKPRRAFSPYLGGDYTEDDIRRSLCDHDARIEASQPDDLPAEVAKRLADGEVVAWFQGRSEFGPRALGNRSILAHPGKAEMVDHLNLRVKGRERFRPFAPTILAEEAQRFFDRVCPSPYMSFTVPVRSDAKSDIPAVTHVDGTSRLQTLTREDNPLFYELLARFRQVTGLPLVLNTSFNLAGEAIVETPSDALSSFLDSPMDALAIGPFLVTKRRLPPGAGILESAVRTAPELLVETVCHAQGEFDRATLYLRGKGVTCDEIGLAILELCADAAYVHDIVDGLADDGFAADDVTAEIRRLFDVGAIVAA